jgi:signal peptidase I
VSGIDKNDNTQNFQDETSAAGIERNSRGDVSSGAGFHPEPVLGAAESSSVEASGPASENEAVDGVPRDSFDDELTVAEAGYYVSPAEAASPAMLELPRVDLLPAEDAEDSSGEENEGSGWKTAWAVVREVGETVILTLIIFLLIQMVVRNFRVVGTSMIGNLQDGQYLIIDKVSYNPYINEYLGVGGPERGDVIVFEPPRRPEEDYVKRIIGLPGEKVQVIQGEVFIDDQLLDEPFRPTIGSYTMPEAVVVPDNQVFVLGDNRNNSNDSHNWGPLPIENIVGEPGFHIGRPICGGRYPEMHQRRKLR